MAARMTGMAQPIASSRPVIQKSQITWLRP
jgi:hypothetical protein